MYVKKRVPVANIVELNEVRIKSAFCTIFDTKDMGRSAYSLNFGKLPSDVVLHFGRLPKARLDFLNSPAIQSSCPRLSQSDLINETPRNPNSFGREVSDVSIDKLEHG
jgi:hypothetical protein